MSVVLQVSDTHFGTEQPRVVEALLRFVRAQCPTLVVLSGDITQRARWSQFRAAKAFTAPSGSGSATCLARFGRCRQARPYRPGCATAYRIPSI
jgi:3',5'-cyclic AMP phosphodiesterase CpdA